MALLFVLPGPLRDLAGDRSEIRTESRADSVSEALDILWADSPAIRDRVMTELGDVRPHVNIFVDGENIRDLDGLASPVQDGSEIVILPAVSGG